MAQVLLTKHIGKDPETLKAINECFQLEYVHETPFYILFNITGDGLPEDDSFIQLDIRSKNGITTVVGWELWKNDNLYKIPIIKSGNI